MKIVKPLIMLLFTALVSSCVHRIGDATVLSTKNMDIKKSLHFVDATHRLHGENAMPIIFIFPTGYPSLKEAVDRCIQQAPGCVGLSDAVIYYGDWYIPFLYGEVSFQVEGNPIFEAGTEKEEYYKKYLEERDKKDKEIAPKRKSSSLSTFRTMSR